MCAIATWRGVCDECRASGDKLMKHTPSVPLSSKEETGLPNNIGSYLPDGKEQAVISESITAVSLMRSALGLLDRAGHGCTATACLLQYAIDLATQEVV
jgi:hypothetical protein